MAFDRYELIDQREKLAKDLDIRLKTINISLEVVEKEINNLTVIKEVLESNMQFLRQEHVIASSTDFKKNKEELYRTENRLMLLIGDRVKIIRALKIMQKLVDENNEEYSRLLQSAETVIISGRFGENKNG